VTLTKLIQMMFSGRDLHRREAKDLEKDVGHLSIYLSFKSGTAFIQMRPRDLHDALIYCGALMIARGTTSQTCDKCGTTFLEGGERNSRNKKRAGSRFCSDTCRYEYHNEQRRKAKLKS
jgi:hypothetical protein